MNKTDDDDLWMNLHGKSLLQTHTLPQDHMKLIHYGMKDHFLRSVLNLTSLVNLEQGIVRKQMEKKTGSLCPGMAL